MILARPYTNESFNKPLMIFIKVKGVKWVGGK